MKYWILLALLCGGVSALHAQSTAFTYQGRLTANGVPANGSHDLRFTLFAVESGGSPASSPFTVPSVGVTNGIFTVGLDFGADAFNGIGHWLAIAVRTGGSTNFITLNPRQRITPTPKALTALTAFTALSVPGVSGNALHAADGSPDNAVFVDTAGRVGVGTTTPASRFHISSGGALPPRLESSSTSAFNAGWDFYHGAAGKGYIGVPDSTAVFAPGEMLVYGGPGTKTTLWAGGGRSLTADTTGNVGVGTTTPAAKLDVRGDVRLGLDGKLLATGGEERLRILRGSIGPDGTPSQGFGFTCTRPSTGLYRIEFISPFSNLSIPVTTANAAGSGNDSTPIVAMFGNATERKVEVILRRGSDGSPVNRYFNFVVIGEAK